MALPEDQVARAERYPAWKGRCSRIPLLSICFRGEDERFEWQTFAGLLVAVSLVIATGWFFVSSVMSDPSTKLQADGFQATPMRPETFGEVLQKYMTAASWEELLPLIRYPETMKPLMEIWYADHPYQAYPEYEIVAQEEGIMNVTPMGPGKDAPWIIALEVQLDPSSDPRLVPMERVGSTYKVDWECAAGYQSISKEAFFEARPTEPHYFRVRMQYGNYYNFAFEDRLLWRAFLLIEPYSQQAFCGYAKRGSTLERELTSLVEAREEIACILALRFPSDNESDGVEITSLLQTEWVVVYVDSESHFDLIP